MKENIWFIEFYYLVFERKSLIFGLSFFELDFFFCKDVGFVLYILIGDYCVDKGFVV